MAYVQQICDGYNKKALMGNWFQERLYPKQPFRQNISKAVRSKDQGITTFDGTGFQRALPRLQRRNKWETANRVVLNDGFSNVTSVMRAEYPNNETKQSLAVMNKPYDKNSGVVNGTSIYPHSEIKLNQKNYHIINRNNGQEIHNDRNVLMYGSDFKSGLPQHPSNQKYTNYVSEYKGNLANGEVHSMRNRTVSDFNQIRKPAGTYKPVYPEQTVRPITTMFCQNKKEVGDEKERTQVQRSWVPQRDKALSYSLGRTAEDFKKGCKPNNDFQTSLNINIGVQNLHPKQIADNFFRHTRTVTVNTNTNLCSRP